ncbi:MAG: hypothetical protein Ct9H300mP15_14270 [Gemmatimonadota bacterium]|nr:MAG: hypothetical protein Ct9H300mP15_14270 [Gemmatimonadota bacterium]
MVQLAVLLLGFEIWVSRSLCRLQGGLGGRRSSSPTPEYLDFWSGPGSGIILVALIVPAFIIPPGLLQKAYGASSERVLRIGIGIQGLVLLVFAMAPPLLGMIARVYIPDLEQVEFAVPPSANARLTTVFGALGLAAVFSAEVSSPDAILFMLSTSLSKDLYKRY